MKLWRLGWMLLALCTVAVSFSVVALPTRATEEAKVSDSEEKASVQQVGGLLFDLDEGVKVEQGPGGSVYMKSNREFMQEKFKEIERRLGAIEKRMTKLESSNGMLAASALPTEPTQSANPQESGGRVLTT